ncbi:hypothetical protein NL676_029081 [Syzygium grande]|nr:hypothetical protein NL676_029081 [Syzygium grande]
MRYERRQTVRIFVRANPTAFHTATQESKDREFQEHKSRAPRRTVPEAEEKSLSVPTSTVHPHTATTAPRIARFHVPKSRSPSTSLYLFLHVFLSPVDFAGFCFAPTPIKMPLPPPRVPALSLSYPSPRLSLLS